MNVLLLLAPVTLRVLFILSLVIGDISALPCSVCGIGFQVTNKEAVAEFSFPGQSTIQIQCGDLQLDGLDGSITSDECTSLPSLIYDTCDCRPVGEQFCQPCGPGNIMTFPNELITLDIGTMRCTDVKFGTPDECAFYQNSTSKQAIVGACGCTAAYSAQVPSPAAHIAPSPTDSGQASYTPYAAPYAYPPQYFARQRYGAPFAVSAAPYAGRPSHGQYTYPTPESGPNFPFFVLFPLFLPIGCIICIYCRSACTPIRGNSATTLPAQRNNVRVSTTNHSPALRNARTVTATIRPSAPAESTQPAILLNGEEAQTERYQILMVLFPADERVLENKEEIGCALRYDEESKQYIFSEERPKNPTCSICLDSVEPVDVLVAGSCAHEYHRQCIINWMIEGHNDCPNCRCLMWDPEVFKMVEESVKAHSQNHKAGHTNC